MSAVVDLRASSERRARQEWPIALLGDLCRTTSGGTPSRKRSDYFSGSIPWVKSGELTDGVISDVSEFISEDALANSSAKIFPAGTLLVALYGATVGKLGFLSCDAATNQAVCAIFPPPSVDPRFLFWYLRHKRTFLVRQAVGGAQPNISQAVIRGLALPVPALTEQNAVVAEIEKQFSRLDEAVASLRRVKANLKRYKIAALRDGVGGRLADTDDHVARRSSSGSRIELPAGWTWTNVASVGRLQLGRQRSPKYHAGPNMRPYLRVQNVFEDRIDLADVMEMNFGDADFARFALQPGDILLNEGQSPELLGRPAMYRGEMPGACFTNTLIRFQAHSCVLPTFALLVFRHYMHSGRFSKESNITTNIAHLSLGRLSNVEFPLPPIAEQQRIVENVDRRLSIVRELEAEVDANLRRAQSLRQAILAKQFAGG